MVRVMKVKGKAIWIMCILFLLFDVVASLTTYVGITYLGLSEQNPFMAEMFAKYGKANPLPYIISTVCPAVAVICMTVNGVVLSRKYMWAEQLTYYALFFINIMSAYVGWWNTVQLLLFGR